MAANPDASMDSLDTSSMDTTGYITIQAIRRKKYGGRLGSFEATPSPGHEKRHMRV